VIAKGNPHGNGAKLARYLITGRHGERAELVELHGLASDDIRTAFAAVELQAAATRCRTPFFHAYVRLPAGEALSRDQWRIVADCIERQLGFVGQGRAVAFHHQTAGDTHMHVAWSRIDLEQRRARDPGLYKNKLKEISRQLERELGLARVSSDPSPGRKARAPGRKEFEQGRRLRTDVTKIREAIRASWDLTRDGRSFTAALASQGLVLARGDRRDFVVVDHAGGEHALSKRITGATAAETRARLADIDVAKLPSVAQAKNAAGRVHPAGTYGIASLCDAEPAHRQERGPSRAISVTTHDRVPPAPAAVEAQEQPVRLSLFRHAAATLVKRVYGFLKRPRPGELPRPGRDTLDGHRHPWLYRGLSLP